MPYYGVLELLVVHALVTGSTNFANIGYRFKCEGGTVTCTVRNFSVTIESNYDPLDNYVDYTPKTSAVISANVLCDFCGKNRLNICYVKEGDGLYLSTTSLNNATLEVLVPVTTTNIFPSLYPIDTTDLGVPLPSDTFPVKVRDAHYQSNSFTTYFNIPWIGRNSVTTAYGFISYTSDRSSIAVYSDGRYNPYFSVLYNKRVSSDKYYRFDVLLTDGTRYYLEQTPFLSPSDMDIRLEQYNNYASIVISFANPIFQKVYTVGKSIVGIQMINSSNAVVFGLIFSGSVPITSTPTGNRLTIKISPTNISAYTGS